MYLRIIYLKNINLFLGALIVMSYILLVSSLEHKVMGDPVFKDPLLKYKIIAEGLSDPTGLVFVDNDILIIEKEGKILLLSDQQLAENPIHEFDVNTKSERGLLGIEYNGRNIFVYLTEISNGDILKNRVYKFLWNGNKLTNQKLLIDLPALPGPNHNGGKLVLEKNSNSSNNDNLYVIIGDLNHRGILQNLDSRDKPDDTGVILKINSEDGSALETNPFSSNPNTAKYFAYGIRNSFGMDFDPLAGKLWNTENGPSYGDEINLVEPGFNSGWLGIQGMAPADFHSEQELVNFARRGNYSDPEFVWTDTVGPTAIKFLQSDKLGKQYENDAFVSDITQGNIYRFDLTNNRTSLEVEGSLVDKIANNATENSGIIFGEGFGGISDLEVGPYDGYLYVVSLGHGAIYRVVPR